MRLCLNCMELYDEQYEVCPFCGFVNGSAGKSATHLKPGTMIHGRYLVGTAIGQGGFGITYVGWDTVLRQKIAIKEYYPTSMANRSGNSGDVYAINAKSQKGYDKGVDKFLAEARTVAQFNKQDEIVHVYDYLKENNTAYIIMEYIEGETLKSKMSKNPDKLYTSVEIANVIRPVILALRTIHCAGVIHRDISPDNIMVTDDGQIKILDFGAAREFSADNAQNMSVILKAGYAPPEQFSKTGHQDPRTDIYALGAVLYRLTTGKMPESSLDRRAKDELVKPRKLNKNMPVWLEKTILKCLALNPEDRFENAEDLLEAFNEREDYFAAREKKSRKGTFIIVALLAVALFSGLGVYFSTDGSKENGFVDTIKGVDGSAEIIESGFLYDEPTGDIFAGVIIENNGDTELMGSSTILLEAKDKNGEVMTSEAFTLECNVYAGDTIGIPFTMYEACDKKPASLEASLSGANYQNQPEYKPLEVEVNRTSDLSYTYGTDFKYSVQNNNEYPVDIAKATIIFRDGDGKIIGGEMIDSMDDYGNYFSEWGEAYDGDSDDATALQQIKANDSFSSTMSVIDVKSSDYKIYISPSHISKKN